MLAPKSLIYGGCYRETCISPPHDLIGGSGLRACMVLAEVASDIQHTWCTWPAAATRDALRGLESRIKGLKVQELDWRNAPANPPEFRYLNPLAPPALIKEIQDFVPSSSPLVAQAALVFGTLEKRPPISAEVVVFDPQNPLSPSHFFENGSSSMRCALVLNLTEAIKLANKGDPYEVAQFFKGLLRGKKSQYEVVVIKMAHAGCWVCTPEEIVPVSAYRTSRVFSIGSGDVFSAAFYAKWALQSVPAVEAATFASLTTAKYCLQGAVSPMLGSEEGNARLDQLPPVSPGAGIRKKKIYLAGPFFSQGEVAFIEHLRNLLTTPWTSVFSPLHDVGFGGPDEVYVKDIKGLEEADVIFAVLSGMDPGTVFEVGYAIKSQKPVFCLAESTLEKDLTMIRGSGATIDVDVASAVYKTLWATLD